MHVRGWYPSAVRDQDDALDALRDIRVAARGDLYGVPHRLALPFVERSMGLSIAEGEEVRSYRLNALGEQLVATLRLSGNWPHAQTAVVLNTIRSLTQNSV